ncbi:hypothetical protein CAEBREN_24621 [Caenorhabditis brenneri]|uniref:Uncharacterized protein n=1 Tax=Caenorhabditis brenneri TaxID=135651 RepID=G0MF30_CAEBE|nr:hypothetical protein CAEBREN_24621 [Caenorhabditis brenneri]
MSSQPTFRGGGGRGGGGRPRGRGARGGQFRGNSRERRSEHPLSPDRRSIHSEDQFRPPRFSNYREPRRPNSRSPSPQNRMQNRNSPHEFSDRSMNDHDRRRRSPGPMRNEDRNDRRIDGNPSRNEESIDVRAVIEDRHPTLKLTGKEKAREWKLRLADAEEEVRRAEYALRRAKMDHEAIKEAYQEYTETTIVRKN